MVRAVRQLVLRWTDIAVLEGASHVQQRRRVGVIDILIIRACPKHCICSGGIGTRRGLLLQIKIAGISSYQLFKRRLLRISFLIWPANLRSFFLELVGVLAIGWAHKPLVDVTARLSGTVVTHVGVDHGLVDGWLGELFTIARRWRHKFAARVVPLNRKVASCGTGVLQWWQSTIILAIVRLFPLTQDLFLDLHVLWGVHGPRWVEVGALVRGLRGWFELEVLVNYHIVVLQAGQFCLRRCLPGLFSNWFHILFIVF